MEQSDAAPPCAEELADPHGRLLGRVVAPRPGPVTGRARGTVYLIRQARTPVPPPATPGATGYAGRR
ncbi:MAG: hypothetical protein ACREOC_00700 [Gemmatimonadales bacterium]